MNISNPDVNILLTPEQMKQDIQQSVDLYRRVHPHTIATFPVQDPGDTLRHLAEQISKSLSRLEFYRTLAPLMNGTGDEHTHLMLPFSELSTQARTGVFFPYDLTIMNGHAWCTQPWGGGAGIPAGAEILSINENPMQEILPVLLGYVSGTSMIQKEFFLSTSFSEALFLGFGAIETFRVQYQVADDSPVQQALINGCQISGGIYSGEAPLLNESPLRYAKTNRIERIEDKTLLLDFNAFENPEGRFTKLVRELFDIANKEGRDELIIDMRKNIGGNSFVAAILLGYLTDQPYDLLDSSELRASEELKQHFLKFMPAVLRWLGLHHLHPWTRQLWRVPQGDMVNIAFKPYQPQHKKKRFRGRVVILSGPGDYSSSAIFLGTVKHYGMAHIIGQPSGGYPTHYGNCTRHILTHSRLELLVPASINYGKGFGPVEPDLSVQNTRESITAGRDIVMETALEWLKKQRKSGFCVKQSP